MFPHRDLLGLVRNIVLRGLELGSDLHRVGRAALFLSLSHSWDFDEWSGSGSATRSPSPSRDLGLCFEGKAF